MIKKIITIILYILFVTIIMPAVITFTFNRTSFFETSKDESEKSEKVIVADNVEIIVESGSDSNPGLEEYIIGVVAAEMPVSFEPEALKAQAVAARTYAVKHLNGKTSIKAEDIGQAYISVTQMKQNWGTNFDSYYNKVCSAVKETQGEIMVYNEQPIEAVFHSTSAGMTESAENVWNTSLPYIKSVDSSVDENAPGFLTDKKIIKNEVVNALNNLKSGLNINSQNIFSKISIAERTQAGYITTVNVDGQSFTGQQFRTLFGLRSTNFTVKESGDYLIFTTKGYGHGAGMSQYGAEFMAKEGKTYKEILNHYYFDIQFTKI